MNIQYDYAYCIYCMYVWYVHTLERCLRALPLLSPDLCSSSIVEWWRDDAPIIVLLHSRTGYFYRPGSQLIQLHVFNQYPKREDLLWILTSTYVMQEHEEPQTQHKVDLSHATQTPRKIWSLKFRMKLFSNLRVWNFLFEVRKMSHIKYWRTIAMIRLMLSVDNNQTVPPKQRCNSHASFVEIATIIIQFSIGWFFKARIK